MFVLQLRRLKKKTNSKQNYWRRSALNEVVSAVGRFSLKSQIIPSLGVDVRAADSSAATANRQTEEGGKKNVSAGTRLNVTFCLSQRHKGNRTGVNKVIWEVGGQTRCHSFCSLKKNNNSNPAFNPTCNKGIWCLGAMRKKYIYCTLFMHMGHLSKDWRWNLAVEIIIPGTVSHICWWIKCGEEQSYNIFLDIQVAFLQQFYRLSLGTVHVSGFASATGQKPLTRLWNMLIRYSLSGFKHVCLTRRAAE